MSRRQKDGKSEGIKKTRKPENRNPSEAVKKSFFSCAFKSSDVILTSAKLEKPNCFIRRIRRASVRTAYQDRLPSLFCP